MWQWLFIMLLRPQIDENLELKIKLYETRKNFVEYPY